jgi:hypothetical protein
MHKAYIVRETEDMRKVLNDTYDELLAAVKKRTPSAESLIDDDEYSQLHDLLALLRFGHIKVSNCENDTGMFLMVEIREDGVC